VGHVDDAHEAERHREAESGDEEDGSEQEAAEKSAEGVGGLEMEIDFVERFEGGFLNRAVGFFGEGFEDVLSADGAEFTEGAASGHALFDGVVLELGECDSLFEGALDLRVGFFLDDLFEEWGGRAASCSIPSVSTA